MRSLYVRPHADSSCSTTGVPVPENGGLMLSDEAEPVLSSSASIKSARVGPRRVRYPGTAIGRVRMAGPSVAGAWATLPARTDATRRMLWPEKDADHDGDDTTEAEACQAHSPSKRNHRRDSMSVDARPGQRTILATSRTWRLTGVVVATLPPERLVRRRRDDMRRTGKFCCIRPTARERRWCASGRAVEYAVACSTQPRMQAPRGGYLLCKGQLRLHKLCQQSGKDAVAIDVSMEDVAQVRHLRMDD